MKKLLLCTVVLGVLFGCLAAKCTKKTHQKIRTIDGEPTIIYECSVKSRPYYEQLQNKTTVNIFYSGTTCKICGCSSSCHNNN